MMMMRVAAAAAATVADCFRLVVSDARSRSRSFAVSSVLTLSDPIIMRPLLCCSNPWRNSSLASIFADSQQAHLEVRSQNASTLAIRIPDRIHRLFAFVIAYG
uniref:Putative secreted protein n=1 Tax=Anopheles triannulatus TaxID=58253 RepID=A0A2M4B5L8_9DIPT